MCLWRKVLLFSFNLLRQRHDISVLLFIVRSHALWRGRMSEFGPIRNHYHVHLVDHSTPFSSPKPPGPLSRWRLGTRTAGQEGQEALGTRMTRLALVVLLFAVLHRADESKPARNSCPRLPHSVDSRFGLYHVAVVLSFLRSSEIWVRHLSYLIHI